jgi:hypothetical protein
LEKRLIWNPLQGHMLRTTEKVKYVKLSRYRLIQQKSSRQCAGHPASLQQWHCLGYGCFTFTHLWSFLVLYLAWLGTWKFASNFILNLRQVPVIKQRYYLSGKYK